MLVQINKIALETGRMAFATVAGTTVLLISLMAVAFMLICAAPRLRA